MLNTNQIIVLLNIQRGHGNAEHESKRGNYSTDIERLVNLDLIQCADDDESPLTDINEPTALEYELTEKGEFVVDFLTKFEVGSDYYIHVPEEENELQQVTKDFADLVEQVLESSTALPVRECEKPFEDKPFIVEDMIGKPKKKVH